MFTDPNNFHRVTFFIEPAVLTIDLLEIELHNCLLSHVYKDYGQHKGFVRC